MRLHAATCCLHVYVCACTCLCSSLSVGVMILCRDTEACSIYIHKPVSAMSQFHANAFFTIGWLCQAWTGTFEHQMLKQVDLVCFVLERICQCDTIACMHILTCMHAYTHCSILTPEYACSHGERDISVILPHHCRVSPLHALHSPVRQRTR